MTETEAAATRVDTRGIPLAAPGMIGLSQAGGDVGRTIKVLQGLNGDGFENWEHAFVMLPGGLILEAEPGGAKIVRQHHDKVYWCEGIYRHCPTVMDASSVLLAQVAEGLKGTPYSFLDYASLTLHHFGVNPPGLRGYIKDTGHEICSQLADTYYLRLGGHVFDDGRWEGDVTPGALYQRDRSLLFRERIRRRQGFA